MDCKDLEYMIRAVTCLAEYSRISGNEYDKRRGIKLQQALFDFKEILKKYGNGRIAFYEPGPIEPFKGGVDERD